MAAKALSSFKKNIGDIKEASSQVNQLKDLANQFTPQQPAPSSAVQATNSKAQNTIDLTIFNQIFRYIYIILCISAIGIIIVLGIISVVDVATYLIKEAIQLYRFKIDPKIFVKDTTDYKIMDYAKSAASISSEPQFIYLEASMFKSVYTIFGISLLILAIQIIIYIIVWVFAEYGGKEPKDIKPDIDIPKQFLLPIIVAFVGAIVLDTLYNSMFVRTCIPKMQTYKNNLNDAKTHVYKMMSVDSDFLNIINGTDYNKIIIKYANMINNKQGHACDINNFPYKDLVAGLITHSLMNLYSSKIPESNIDYNTVMKFFTYEEIIAKTFDPLQFMYYKQTPNIGNIWVSMKDDIRLILEDPDGMNNTKFFDTYREDALRTTVDQYIRDINLKLASLYTLPRMKSKVLIYIIAFSIIAVLFLILVIFSVFSADLIDSVIAKIKNMIKGGDKKEEKIAEAEAEEKNTKEPEKANSAQIEDDDDEDDGFILETKTLTPVEPAKAPPTEESKPPTEAPAAAPAEAPAEAPAPAAAPAASETKGGKKKKKHHHRK